jgi:hypothetical protein
MSRWLFGLNSFVLPIREVDVGPAPLLGRLCALMEKIPADYQLSFFKVLSYNCLRIQIFIIRLIGLPQEVHCNK